MTRSLVTSQMAEEAVRLALPSIHAAMKSATVGESGFLYIVVLDPARDRHCCEELEEAVLYEHAVGDRSKWDADYAAYALAKARISWRTGFDSHAVLALRPHLLVEDDLLVWGSVVLDGIVVSVSGANPWYDEAFATMVAGLLRALAKAAIETGKKLDCS
jgi:hypothetical protein